MIINFKLHSLNYRKYTSLNLMSSLRIFYEFLFGVIILIAFRVCKTG